MKTKAAKLFSCFKYELGIFILLGLQAFMNLNPYYAVGEYIELYYLVDFSMGKTSRLLLGSIVSLFTDNPTPEWIEAFAVTVLYLVIALVSVLLGKVIRKTSDELKPQIYVLMLFFVSGPFGMFGFSRYLGMLDIYMFIFTVLAVLCACNKYLRWLVPLFCAAGVFTHHAFAITYFPLIILVVFYLMLTQEKKGGNAGVFALASAVTVALTLYCATADVDAMNITFDEMKEIIKQRSGYDYSETGLGYIGFYFYNIAPEAVGLNVEQISESSALDLFLGFAKYVQGQGISAETAIPILLMAAAAVAVFAAIWICCMKNTDSKVRRFVYFCFMAFMLFIPVCFTVAQDYVRWAQAGVLVQFGLMFLMFVKKDEPFKKTMQQFKAFFSNKKFLLVVIYAAYALAIPQDLTV